LIVTLFSTLMPRSPRTLTFSLLRRDPSPVVLKPIA
jgi:hypothetical protein